MKSRLSVPFRRKRERITNYRKRLVVLRSKFPRTVVRTSLKNIIIQLTTYNSEGDKVLLHADSKELSKYGWLASGGNVPAAYLTGYLFGMRAKKHDMCEAILDIGLHVSTKGSRVYAALRGMLDGGMNIPHDKECLPDEGRVSGKHITDYAATLPKEQYQTRFSGYIKAGIEPASLEKYVTATKKHIEGARHGKE